MPSFCAHTWLFSCQMILEMVTNWNENELLLFSVWRKRFERNPKCSIFICWQISNLPPLTTDVIQFADLAIYLVIKSQHIHLVSTLVHWSDDCQEKKKDKPTPVHLIYVLLFHLRTNCICMDLAWSRLFGVSRRLEFSLDVPSLLTGQICFSNRVSQVPLMEVLFLNSI